MTKLSGVKVNGIEVGEGSVLLSKRHKGVVTFTPSEADVQAGVLELLVGKASAGQPRTFGGGMTEKHPELMLMYAINPNKGGNNSRAARGIAKAMGNLAGLCDLCLPVARGPFHSLYLEVKTLTGRVDKEQKVIHDWLRDEGHCVMVGRGIEGCMMIVLGYLALPRNRMSVRPVPHAIRSGVAGLDEQLAEWRRQSEAMLKPEEKGK